MHRRITQLMGVLALAGLAFAVPLAVAQLDRNTIDSQRSSTDVRISVHAETVSHSPVEGARITDSSTSKFYGKTDANGVFEASLPAGAQLEISHSQSDEKKAIHLTTEPRNRIHVCLDIADEDWPYR